MNSQDIRKKFKDYFTAQNHIWVPSSSLIPKGDSSLLFTNAGMNQFKDCFLGLKPPPAEQVCSIQKCLRVGGKHNDLEEVGHSPYHHTFFEMIGSFCFGSYFKTQAIDYAMNFLTKQLGLPKEKLWVSVFKKDKESAKIWHKTQKMPLEKIFLLNEKDNFWRMGKTGPCGPCSEIYYYSGSKKNPKPEDMTEVWNLVFMEFNEDQTGKKTPLPKPCIDTGMGLERLTAILQGKKSNYHTVFFKKIIQSIEEASDAKYQFTHKKTYQDKIQTAFQVIADHSRSICFLICDGVLPGSEGASYILRRILRRALFYSQKLKSNKNLLCLAAREVIHLMSDIYPELNKEKMLIDSTIKKETKLFTESLKAGKNILLQKMKNLPDKTVPDHIIWDLYSTYGFPPDLTRLIAREKGFTINENFNLDKFKEEKISTLRKQNTQEKEFNPIDYNLSEIKETEFTGYKKNKEQSKVAALLFIPSSHGNSTTDKTGSFFSYTHTSLLDSIEKEKNKLKISLKPHESQGSIESPIKQIPEQDGKLWLITDKTCFYPEGGGPIGDKGTIKTKTGEIKVWDCQKKGNFIVHKIKVLKGKIKKNQSCTMQVDKDHRRLIATSHSATHLLNQALRDILGESVRQMGSLVEPGELRFDFSYSEPLNSDQLKKIENKIIEQIKSKHFVSDAIYSYEKALEKGALSLPGENYEQEVRVIRMGKSLELCGGIHVKNTSEIGGFKIISETGVQSGVRRITAYTSDKLIKWQQTLEKQNKTLKKYLFSSNLKIPNKINTNNLFIQWLISKETEIKSLKSTLKTSINKPKKPVKTEEEFFLKKNQRSKHSEHKPTLSEVELNLGLRKYLKQPIPRLPKPLEEEPNDLKEDFFISFFQKKEQEFNTLKKGWEHLCSSFHLEKIMKKVRPFQHQNINGHLLSVALPIEDRKILAEIADQLKSQLPTAAITVVLGQGEHQYPLVITVSKELQKYISAGEILKKTIAPFLGGKGGGQARFAQGTIKNKNLFFQLEDHLLKILNKTKKNTL